MNNNELINKIVNNVSKVIFGKENEIIAIMKGIIAGGHILIEDVPGVGKTTLVKALSKSLDLSYNRIQFTPDLLPSDITGVSIYNPKILEFEYKKGPVFANIVLADEINRTSPKTQSALLEVMEEKQVSDGNNRFMLDEPFFVMATQNPIEHEGTFILPEAELDRFMIKVDIGYPEKEYERMILNIYRNTDPLDKLQCIASAEDIINLQKECREVMSFNDINDYIVEIVAATRKNKNLLIGGSIRASLALLKISQATAMIKGRKYIIPEDVKENAVLVLGHRVILSPYSRTNGIKVENIIKDIVDKVPVPRMV